MASTERPRNARAFAAGATLAAAGLLALAVWRAAERTTPAAPEAPPPRLPAPGVLCGQVVATNRSGIAGLRVTAAGRETVTGAQGTFALAGLEPGRHRVRVEGPGIVASEVDDAEGWVRIAVARTVVIAGRVAEAGRPAVGALIQVAGGSLPAPRETVAGADGRFAVVELPEGSYAVTAISGVTAALAADVDRFGPGPFAPLELALAPAARVAGVVVDGDGAPVAGAHVVLVPEIAEPALRRAASDSTGHFAIDGLPPGAWTVDADAPGHTSPSRLLLNIVAGGEAAPRIVVGRGGVVAGRVVDATGAPVVGAVVELAADRVVVSAPLRARRAAWAAGTAPAGAGPILPIGELGITLGPVPFPPPTPVKPALPAGSAAEPAGFLTAADGRFRIDAVPPRAFTVRAVARDFAGGEAQVTATEGGTANVVVTLRRGTEVLARVVDEGGNPVGGAEVTLLAAGRAAGVAFAGADGRARFANVLGPVALRVATPGRAAVERALGPLPEAGSVEETVAVAAAGASVSGAVVDGEGRPVGLVAIAAAGPGGAVARAVSDPHGRFTLRGLAAGRWRLEARHADFAPAVVWAEAGTDDVEIMLSGGGGVRADVRDALTSGPILAFAVRARGPNGADLRRAFARGELELTSLAPGPWTLTVEARGYATRELQLEVPAGAGPRPVTVDGLRIELDQGAVVGGTVYSSHGDPVAGATVEAGPVHGTTGASGGFRLAGVPTGETVLRARHASEGAADVVVPLHAGDEVLTLVVRLAP
jgi:hypothetical protein